MSGRRRTLAAFEVWLGDFEYGEDANRQPEPRCLVALELHSAREVRLTAPELRRRRRAPFPVDDGTVFCAYSSPAELRCFLALGWPLPSRVLDPYVEFRALANGRTVPAGYGLIGALTAFGLDSLDVAQKESMRQLALRGGRYTAAERQALLDYCARDVYALQRLLVAMAPYLDLPRAFMRGRYMRAVARMMHTGVPVDAVLLGELRAYWEAIQAGLIAEVDGPFAVYERGSFRQTRWLGWCQAQGIPWPQLASGAPSLAAETFATMSEVYPEVRPIMELRAALGQMRPTRVIAGPDARNRAWLAPFATKTGRNAPPSSEFLFGASAWLRHVIQPPPGYGLAYVDWEQQEIGIAAALSEDTALQMAYRSGDPYLAFGQQAGLLPRDASKASHGRQRELLKVCVLGLSYGMGEQRLAQRLKVPLLQAHELIDRHHRTYRTLWGWLDREIAGAYLTGSMGTVYGWTLHGVKPYRRSRGHASGVSRRTLQNFPAQAHGADMMRIAACLMTEAGIAVCAPVHDAFLIEAPLDELDAVVAEAQGLMGKASETVLGGFRLRTEAAVYRYPDHYQDAKGAAMWATVQRHLRRVHEEVPQVGAVKCPT